jgi:hypothetical protein
VGERNGKSKLPDDMTDSIGHQLRQHFDDIDPDVIVGVSVANVTGPGMQIIIIGLFKSKKKKKKEKKEKSCVMSNIVLSSILECEILRKK